MLDSDCDKIEIWILIEFSYKISLMFRIEFVVLEKCLTRIKVTTRRKIKNSNNSWMT